MEVILLVWIIDIIAWVIFFLIRTNNLFPWEEDTVFGTLCVLTMVLVLYTVLKIIGIE